MPEPLLAINPIDGRYSYKTSELQNIFSEFSLIKYRVLVEVRYFQALANYDGIVELAKFSKEENSKLESIITKFSLADAKAIKAIEKTINHDLKAVEYFIKDQLKNTQLAVKSEFVHFACTSEDINNISYALMLVDAREVLFKKMEQLRNSIATLAEKYRTQPLLSRTHGQPASPTTMGKEFANVVARLDSQIDQFRSVVIRAKLNGAVGAFNAHISAYPSINWQQFSTDFIKSLGLEINPLTTQIEPHDYIAQYLDVLRRFNTVLLDFSRDIWAYIAAGHFKQKTIKNEVGSSTMPHKVNPIDFENAEGNLGLANALGSHLVAKLPISRLQRDLSDSTVLRNLGLPCAYGLIAYKSILNGLNKLAINATSIKAELDNNWQVLAEPIQTVMRRYGIDKPYEKLKDLTRNKDITKNTIATFIKTLDIPDDAKQRLLELTPENYLGNAREFKL